MANKKRREMFLSNDKLVPIKVGYSLGTVYRVNPVTNSTYEILNFGYCPIDGSFYYNRNINLPEEIVSYCESANISSAMDEQMQKMGLFSYDDVERLLNNYYRAKDDVVKSKQKILNIKETLSFQDK